MPALFRAGAAWQDLPAHPGLDLSGYALRVQPCTAVRDAVSVTALALEQQDTLFILLSVDALGFAIGVAETVRQKITAAARQMGQWQEIQVCLAATHSHAAPASMPLRQCGEVNPQWLEKACEIIVQTALQSAGNLQPARFGAGQTDVPGVALNRRNGPAVDHQLTAWRIDDTQGKPLALAVNFACHPVVLSHENRAVSADYPGEVRRVLQEEWQIPVLFLTGAAGDINPVHRGETAALEQTAVPLIHAVKELWPRFAMDADVPLRGSYTHLDLPLQALPPREILLPVAQGDPLPARRAWAEQALACEDGARLTVPCAVQVWRVGPSALAAVGCELFASLGLRLKNILRESAVAAPLIVAYANSNLGYVPDAAAYERGGYEVDSAHWYYGQPACVTPGAGEMLVNAVTQEIKNDNPNKQISG